jgi:hypothetical protein
MSTNKTYRHHCPVCNEETPHVPSRSLSVRVAIRTWKLLVFFISGGFIYPQPLPSEDDPVKIRCTKCLTGATITGG